MGERFHAVVTDRTRVAYQRLIVKYQQFIYIAAPKRQTQRLAVFYAQLCLF